MVAYVSAFCNIHTTLKNMALSASSVKRSRPAQISATPSSSGLLHFNLHVHSSGHAIRRLHVANQAVIRPYPNMFVGPP